MVFFPDFLGPVIHILVSLGKAGSLSKYYLGKLRKEFRLFSFSKTNTLPAYYAAN
jgi:hypothetical protein